jgi:hypothetical protein
MGVGVIWLSVLFLVIYPLVSPWKRPFIVGWLVIWFSLWAFFFVLTDSVLVDIAIFIFAVSSLLRIVSRGVVQWLGRKR